jgi:hypothetical protein
MTRQELALLGWTIGRNVQIDTRWATANAAGAPRLCRPASSHPAYHARVPPASGAAVGARSQARRILGDRADGRAAGEAL